MGRKTVKGSPELAKAIKTRRNELNLTIEEAASKAGVGTKTWSRYESGESISKDKCNGIRKALNWHTLPNQENDDSAFDFDACKNHKAWSKYLANAFSPWVATSFVIGSDILLDKLSEDMTALASMPRGSHIGETGFSWLEGNLPQQFLMRYDYDFLYVLNSTVVHLRRIAGAGTPIVAHSVIEELALYLISEESEFLMESADFADDERWDEWVFDVFDDMDLITFLYYDVYLDSGHPYHFDHWLEKQFYVDR